jgi:MoaA/NifB/PqqE/SkfB family radical SAM enzyme
MNEWTSQYNPFNSMKALVHAEHFESILASNPKPPIVINFDLTNKCNYDCRFCMFGTRERADKNSYGYRYNQCELPKGYALKLPKLWKKWGVKAVCLAGGGEPTLHKDCKAFMKECKKQGLELGFVTNGLLINSNDWMKTVCETCKFIGFSIDAGDPESYRKTKGVDEKNFYKVIQNISCLDKHKKKVMSQVQIGFKFVLDEENYLSIYKAAVVAKFAGVNHFHFRPAINQNYKFFADKIGIIKEQLEEAHKIETDHFKVFGIFHKFNDDLSKKHNFAKCRANLLTSTWCADGKVYMCTDSRGCKWSYLTDHYPNPEKAIQYWGSKEHLNKVRKINFKKNCDRCTLAPYNEYFEQIFINDKMDRNLI